MSIAAVALIGALIYKLVDFGKLVTSKNVNGVVTQLVAWVVGVGVVFLASAADVTNKFAFNGVVLSDLDGGSKVFLGLLATSIFSAVYDLKSALDNDDSAKTAPLLPNAK